MAPTRCVADAVLVASSACASFMFGWMASLGQSVDSREARRSLQHAYTPNLWASEAFLAVLYQVVSRLWATALKMEHLRSPRNLYFRFMKCLSSISCGRLTFLWTGFVAICDMPGGGSNTAVALRFSRGLVDLLPSLVEI